MEKDLAKRVIDNEYSFIRLFCKEIITDNFIRFYDDKLKDAYDNNFSQIFGDMVPGMLTEIIKLKKERNESHIKITLLKKNEGLSILGFKYECLLTMVAEQLNIQPLKIKDIQIKSLKENPDLVNDFLELEMKYYGDIYGKDFVGRKMYRYFDMIMQDNGLNYFGCYVNNKLVAHVYSYYDKGVVCVDGLLVDEEYRNKYIASNLVNYIKNYYNCPICLHADYNEEIKDAYMKIGFKTIYETHNYLLLDSSEDQIF